MRKVVRAVKRLLRKVLYTALIVLLLLVALTTVTPQGRTAVRTALFIPQVLPTIPLKPQEWFTPEPVWKEVSYPQATGEGVADLILPADAESNSAVLFFMGVVSNKPRDDSRVVALAEGLARSGMVVMIPWSDTQLQQRIVPDDIDDLVSAFQYLSSLDEVDPERMGMGGICTGASMATIAAQDDRIRDNVRFINFFAGYYDAVDFTRAIGSKSRFYGDYVAPWDTDKLTYRVFRNHLIDGVPDPAERALLTGVFKDQQPALAAEVASLSTEGAAVYKLLEGVSLDEADVLVDQLSAETKDFFRRVSPSTNIEKLKARVLIMHDRADRLVPSEESRRMADALADVPGTYHTEFSLFQKEIQVHVGESGGLGVIDFAEEALKLYMHMYNIMRDIS